MTISAAAVYALNRMNGTANKYSLGTLIQNAESVAAAEIALANGSILIGNGSGVGAANAVSGDISLSNAGVAAIASGVIVNADVNASAAIDFSKLGALASGNILVGSAGTVPTSVAMSGDVAIIASGATTIQAGAVTLGKLAAGVAPSHVVKFAGKFTTVGGDAAEQASVAGVVAGDVVVACVQTQGTGSRTLLSSIPGTDVIDFVLSGDPTNDHVISYVVYRAAA
jgi:hypothetical protein